MIVGGVRTNVQAHRLRGVRASCGWRRRENAVQARIMKALKKSEQSCFFNNGI